MARGGAVSVSRTGRAARVLLAVLAGCVVLGLVSVDMPEASGGRFWSDGATYYAMAWSLAADGDLRFEPRDLQRIRERYPVGPQGVFLKRERTAAGERLVFAKSAAYPLFGAPFVRVLGPDRGLLAANGVLFSLALLLGWSMLRDKAGPLLALGAVVAAFAGTVAPVYLFWFTPEVFNLALATGALAAWRHGRSGLAAVLFGWLAYSKPTYLLLALPLLADPLFGPAGGWPARLRSALGRAALVGAAALAGFAVTWIGTGEVNYQGGERKTFYDRYPFDAPGATFDSTGLWMATDRVGPRVEGEAAAAPERPAAERPAAELRQSFLWNLAYFWSGRFGGAVPYFFPLVGAVLAFATLGPRSRAGWLALAVVAASWLAYVWIIPDNWYGGAGTVGNRYFIALLPLAFVLVPRGRAAWLGAAGVAACALWTGRLIASPVAGSVSPGAHAVSGVFRLLPFEQTMLSDLSVFTDVWRKRRPYHQPDAARPDPGAYFLWFPDDGTFGQEESFGEEGFWLRGGAQAEVLVQARRPPREIRLEITAGPAGDVVSARLGRQRERAVLPAFRTRTVVLRPSGRELRYYGTTLYRLRLSSRQGGPNGADRRALGSFVRVELASPAGPVAPGAPVD
jgi:hypothetical protein